MELACVHGGAWPVHGGSVWCSVAGEAGIGQKPMVLTCTNPSLYGTKGEERSEGSEMPWPSASLSSMSMVGMAAVTGPRALTSRRTEAQLG